LHCGHAGDSNLKSSNIVINVFFLAMESVYGQQNISIYLPDLAPGFCSTMLSFRFGIDIVELFLELFDLHPFCVPSNTC
jgi:hypothetical protein